MQVEVAQTSPFLRFGCDAAQMAFTNIEIKVAVSDFRRIRLKLSTDLEVRSAGQPSGKGHISTRKGIEPVSPRMATP